jgi:hypothetical protein
MNKKDEVGFDEDNKENFPLHDGYQEMFLVWSNDDLRWYIQAIDKDGLYGVSREAFPLKAEGVKAWKLGEFIMERIDRTPKMEKGTQILYVPQHARGDSDHPSVEEGFVMSVQGGMAFCRYWSGRGGQTLRTKLNREATPIRNLVVKDTHSQKAVDRKIAMIEGD